MATTLYICDRFVTTLQELRTIVEEVGDNYTQKEGRQLISAACDGVLEQWLQESEGMKDSSLTLSTQAFTELAGDSERWNLIKRIFTGKTTRHKFNFLSLLEIELSQEKSQLEKIGKGEDITLEFHIKCKEALDEKVKLELQGVQRELDMNIQGVQVVSFSIDGSHRTTKAIELFVVGDNIPVWRRETGLSNYSFSVNGTQLIMVRVEGGKYWMGARESDKQAASDEKPIHRVVLDDYFIGETQVTQALWKAVMSDNPSDFKGENKPVENISWDKCAEFVQRLNNMLMQDLPKGYRFRLPTEAEWEYAASGRLHNRSTYSGSEHIDSVACYKGNSSGATKDVKTLSPNELGIYDMSGNVREWCQDWYGPYSSLIQTNPSGPATGTKHIARGGCASDEPANCRITKREAFPPEQSKNNGLRLVLKAEK